jgi:uncharacterized protein YnzC (UPF0291/DUF896 family)
MSTSATQPGTTTRAGRSGKGLGIAAAALAIVIAAGFVFAVNRGNEVTGSGVNELSGPGEIAAARHAERVRLSDLAAQAALRPDGAAEINRLNELAAKVRAESHPAFNIEATKMELAAQAALRPDGAAEINRLNELAAKVRAESHPAFNIEATKMELARQNTVYPGTNPETRTNMLIELNQPEWDNRTP